LLLEHKCVWIINKSDSLYIWVVTSEWEEEENSEFDTCFASFCITLYTVDLDLKLFQGTTSSLLL
jgi:hypothetical protein